MVEAIKRIGANGNGLAITETEKRIAIGMNESPMRVHATIAVQRMMAAEKEGLGGDRHLSAIREVAGLIADHPEASAVINEM